MGGQRSFRAHKTSMGGHSPVASFDGKAGRVRHVRVASGAPGADKGAGGRDLICG